MSDTLESGAFASTRALRVFISNAPAQDALSAQLTMAFQSRGWEVWRHTERSKSAAYRALTLQALERADIVVVLWSQASSESPWIIDEADAGMKKGAAVAVELQGVTGPLGFAGAQRVRVASAIAGLSPQDQTEIWEAVLDVADASGLLGHRQVWLDRSAAATAAHILASVGVFGLLELAATLAKWPGFLLGFTGLLLCLSFVVASIGGSYAGDWISQRLGALPRSYRRRLLFRWLGEAVGAGFGGMICYLIVSNVRGYSLSSEWPTGVQIMLGGVSFVSFVLLTIKFVPLMVSKRLHRRLLGHPS